jgi:hypothetical protein
LIAVPHRTERRERACLPRLTPRDWVALRFVGEAGPAPSDAVGVIMGSPSDVVVRRRVRAWRDLGLVRVLVPAVNAHNWLSLTEAGRHAASDKFGMEAGRLLAERTLPAAQFLAHTAGVVRLRAAVMAASVLVKPVLELVLHEDERQIRSRRGVGRGERVAIPDAIFVVEYEDGARRAVVIELDQGATASPRVYAEKARAYYAARRAGQQVHGCTDWSVGIVSVNASERRVHRLALAVGDAVGASALLHFARGEELTQATVLAAEAWQTIAAEPGAVEARLVPSNPFRQPVLSKRSVRQNAGDPR